MKSLKHIVTALLAVAALCIAKPAQVHAQSVSFQVFYDDLSPYGQWVDYSSYGYVWVPSAGPDFVPYSSGGHWVWTDYGWTWVSDYSWGWAPFHYGRWDYDPYYGWVWIPGNDWGPAWVTWRHSEGYYGWAPLGPGVSVEVAIGGYNPPPDHWVFVNEHYMGRHDINHYYGPRSNNQTYINNSTVINNTYVDNSTHNTYVTGPRREDVQKSTGRQIKTVAVRESAKPGEHVAGGQLNIYRPKVDRGAADVKPARIATKDQVKPVNERPAMNKAAAPNNNAARTPANGKQAAPANRQPAQQRQANTPANGKQPLNARPATQQNRQDAAPKQQRSAPAAQPQQRQQPVQQSRPQQQQPKQQAQPAPQQRQQTMPQQQRQQQTPQQRPQPQAQPMPQQRQQPAPQPQAQPQRQAPAPAPAPHPMPAPQSRPAPGGGGRPH